MRQPQSSLDLGQQMLHRLRRTLVIALLLVAIQLASRFVEPGRAGAIATTPGELSKPATLETVIAEPPRAVLPEGWRRTADGWEHVSQWARPLTSRSLTLGELVVQQHEREPWWIRRGLAAIRRVSPVVMAVAQVLIFAWVLGRKTPEPLATTNCPAT